MIFSFLLSLLVLLFYFGLVIFAICVLVFFWEKIFGAPVPPRLLQLLYALVSLAFAIWLIQCLATHTPILAPWQWR